MTTKRKFWAVSKIRADNGGSAGRLDIYGDIDASQFWEDTYTPNRLLDELKSLGPITQLDVHVFSNGGDVFSGLAIHSILRQRRETVNIYIEGIAASIATIITCAGDTTYIAESAMMMVHNPFTMLFFESLNAEDARILADELDKARSPMISAYVQKTGRSEAEIIALMDGDNGRGTWLTAEEAIEFGLADAYTPESKRPMEAVARLGPAVFSWRGHKIDMSGFPDAARRTKNITKKSKMGGKKQMAKRRGFFNFGKRKATRKRAEVALVDMICPHCNADVLLNPETAEVVLAGTVDEAGMDPEEEVVVEARRMKGRVRGRMRAEVFTVTCPSCGEEFIWDTDLVDDGEMAEPVTDTTPMGADSEVVARRRRKARARNQKRRRTRAEIMDTICPDCGAAVSYDTETVPITADENGIEGYDLICLECGAEFIDPIAIGEDPIPLEDPIPEVVAKRRRKSARRGRRTRAEVAEAICPSCSTAVSYDTDNAEIITDENGVEGYALVCHECGVEFLEPIEAAVPEAIPVDTPAPLAYRRGIHAERQRMLALDEMAMAAPGMEAMIAKAKRSGASAQAMSRNLFKAMAKNPNAQGQRRLGAIQRDAEASGVNAMHMPGHFNGVSAFAGIVSKKLEDR